MGRHGTPVRRLVTAGALFVRVLSAEVARADETQVAAAAAFDEGQRAFLSGDYARAARAFELAYAKKPHHDPLWNAARSRHRAGEMAAAANLYARYLGEAPANAPDRDKATAALFELRAIVARLEVHAAPGVVDVRIDGTALAGTELYVDPGEHLIEATAGDGSIRKTASAKKGESTHVTLEPPAEEPSPSSPPGLPLRGEEPPAPKRFTVPWPIIAGGVVATVTTAAVTVWSGLDTADQKERFDSSRSQSDLDEGRSRQTRTNVLLGVTLGLAALTAVAALLGRF